MSQECNYWYRIAFNDIGMHLMIQECIIDMGYMHLNAYNQYYIYYYRYIIIYTYYYLYIIDIYIIIIYTY